MYSNLQKKYSYQLNQQVTVPIKSTSFRGKKNPNTNSFNTFF